MVLRACFTQIWSFIQKPSDMIENKLQKTGSGVIDTSLSIALGKVIKTKALALKGNKQQKLWC